MTLWNYTAIYISEGGFQPWHKFVLPAETTLAQAGNFINSFSCGPHFLSSERSQFVPNLIIRLKNE